MFYGPPPSSRTVHPDEFSDELFDEWDAYCHSQEAIYGGEVLAPTFEMVCSPTIQLSEAKARRFYIVDRATIYAKSQIQADEDSAIISAIGAAIGHPPTSPSG